MTADRIIRRYAAFFRGWAQAFGEHEKLEDPTRGLRWLVGQDQIGLILTPAIKRQWFPRLIGHPSQDPPPVTLRPECIEIAGVRLDLRPGTGAPLPPILALLALGCDLHLYQTYHLIYPSGTRILTLSARAPLGILYRELPPLCLCTLGEPLPAASPIAASVGARRVPVGA
jgi:hypothetical protein